MFYGKAIIVTIIAFFISVEIKASGGLQKCADESVSRADAHFAARTPDAFLNINN